MTPVSPRHDWSVIDIDDSHERQVRALFEHVFEQPMSPALWQWKYGGGRGVGVGALSPSGEMLAHYGGTRRDVHFFDHPLPTLQIGDVMVAAEGRAALAHKGPFGLVTEAFLERHLDSGHNAVLGFGFPSARHMRLGERLGHYAEVDPVYEISWPLLHGSAGAGGFVGSGAPKLELAAIDWIDVGTNGRLDSLWEGMRNDLRNHVVPTRNSVWWRHRFSEHPGGCYQCYWLHDPLQQSPMGAVAVRVPSSLSVQAGGVRTVELLDWISPVAEVKRVIDASKDIAISHNAPHLMGWFSGAVAARFAADDLSTRALACTAGVTVRRGSSLKSELAQNSVPSVARLQHKWWLTGGDTDFR